MTDKNFNEQDHLLYRCVIGSRAYNLHRPDSDSDVRGVYIFPASRHWSLFKPADTVEYKAPADEAYFELEKFMHLAVQSNPNILEMLWTPLTEVVHPLFQDLLDNRDRILSRRLIPKYEGYAFAQYQKLTSCDPDKINWKHGMHCMRLLISATYALESGEVLVWIDDPDTNQYLKDVRAGVLTPQQFQEGYEGLLAMFERAKKETQLREEPDYEFVNQFLQKCRLYKVEEEFGAQ